MPRSGESSDHLVADFETTTDPFDCRVWLWAIASIDTVEVIDWGTSIESFIRMCAQRNSRIFFHNLRFDGFFLLHWLLCHGYAHTEEKFPRPGQFTTLISKEGNFYNIRVKWKNGANTEFRDSLKKLPMTVERIAESFKLEESKGSIEYDAYRPYGYDPTDDELQYVFNDVLIVAKALAQQKSQGLTRLTVGSDALKAFQKGIEVQLPFRNIFPVLNETVDAEVRRAYRGGFTYVSDRFKGRVVGPGKVYDVNSLYPSVMYSEPMPYGEPIFCSGRPETDEIHPLYIMTVTFTAQLKANHIPCIPEKSVGRFGGAAVYLHSFSEPKQMSVTCVDWDLWNEHYDIDVWSYDGSWLFKSITGVFQGYIDHWAEIKATSEGGLRELAKLMLNSLYGKFATNPNTTGKIPYLKEDRNFPGKHVVGLRKGKDSSREPVYTPVGAFITAYARAVTIRAAQRNYETFAYCDTDSLHLITWGEPEGVEVHPRRMGAWKHELSFDAALFVRPKCYTERSPNDESLRQLRWAYDPDGDGEYHTHIAGMPAPIARQMKLADFTNGRVFRGKLNPHRVPGGVVLEDIGFTLNIDTVESDCDGPQAED